MGPKNCLAGLCLAVLAATVIDVPPVEAQTKKQVYTAQPDRPVNRPRARVTVAPRSFLDAGTEVLPGERKFTDYALPAGSYFDAFERGAKHGWTRRLAPVAAAGAVRSSEPL
jgi:hypothetical protein